MSSLILYMHPLASFCWKPLIALYEHGTDFEARRIDLADPEDSARLETLWPIGKFPVLQDTASGRVVPESSLIVEYLDLQAVAGSTRLLPTDAQSALETRLWDRFFDLYVQTPMQKAVADALRAADVRDPHGVAEARATLKTAYDMVERQAADKRWIAGETFSLADCSAAPALFYALCVEPFGEGRPALNRYFDQLMDRPSVRRVIDEARPFFAFFPLLDSMPKRFR